MPPVLALLLAVLVSLSGPMAIAQTTPYDVTVGAFEETTTTAPLRTKPLSIGWHAWEAVFLAEELGLTHRASLTSLTFFLEDGPLPEELLADVTVYAGIAETTTLEDGIIGEGPYTEVATAEDLAQMSTASGDALVVTLSTRIDLNPGEHLKLWTEHRSLPDEPLAQSFAMEETSEARARFTEDIPGITPQIRATIERPTVELGFALFTPVAMVWDGPTATSAGTDVALTLRLLDEEGLPSSAAEATVLTLSTDGDGGAFHSTEDPSSAPITELTMTEGAADTEVIYRSPTASSTPHMIAAERSSGDPVGSATHEMQVTAAPASDLSLALTGPDRIAPDGVTAVRARVADSNGNPVEGVTVSFSSSHPARATIVPEAITDADGLVDVPAEAAGDDLGLITLTATIDGADANVEEDQSAEVSITVQEALEVSTTTLPDWTVGQPVYTTSAEATGGEAPYNWQLVDGAFSEGLTLSSDGTIEGTPEEEGTFTATLQVIDDTGWIAYGEVSLTIHPPPTISTGALEPATVDEPYATTLEASGGTAPLVWTADPLPEGLSLNETTGTVSGTPVSMGITDVTLTVADAVGASASLTLELRVTAADGTLLRFATQPESSVEAGQALTSPPAVHFTDADGIPQADVALRASVQPQGGLIGTTSHTTDEDGRAIFPDLRLTRTGTYTLQIESADGMHGATSEPFTVTAGAPASLTVSADPAEGPADGETALVLVATLTDPLGNGIPDAPITLVGLAGSAASGVAGLSAGDSADTDKQGNATFEVRSTQAGSLTVGFRATDDVATAGEVTFVRPPPADFDLRAPVDASTVYGERLLLQWAPAASEEPVRYTLHIARGDGEELVRGGLRDTTYTLPLDDTFFQTSDLFTWWVEAHGSSSHTTSRQLHQFTVDTEAPPGFALQPNYPNPFADATTIRYHVPMPSRVYLRIYDLQGRLVHAVVDRGGVAPGTYAVSFQADALPTGPYVYRMSAEGADGTRFTQSRTMMHIR